MILKSTAAKVSVGGTLVAAGGLPATYWATQDYRNFFEVERKVIKEEVAFSVTEDKSTTVSGKKFWKIEATGNDLGASKNYSWDCIVTVKENVSVDKELEIILNKKTGNTPDIRRRLIQSCSKDRKAIQNKELSHKEIHSKVDLFSSENKDDVISKLFEGEILNEVERAIIEDTNKVYFEISVDSSKKITTLKSKTDETNVPFKTKNYSWKCTLSSVPAGVDKTKLEQKLPGNKDDVSNDEKKLNRKKLVYACSTGGKLNLEFPADATDSNWDTQLLGT